MANRLIRCIYFCLLILLSCDPVTQDLSESEDESSSAPKVSFVFTEEATPPLSSILHTEAITPDHIDENTLVNRPAIAPATPWEDTQILSTISELNTKPHSTDRGAVSEDVIPDTLAEDHKEFQNFGDSEQQNAELDVSSDSDDLEKLIKNLDPVKDLNNEQQDLGSKLSDSSESGEDSGPVENVENKQTNGEKVYRNELSDSDEFDMLGDEVIPTTNQNTNELSALEESKKEPINGRADETLGTPEVDDDLSGAQDGLGGTQEDMPSFKEWSQKFLAQEEEKKVQQINEKGSMDSSIQPKKKLIDRKQNNYASVDCGANIPEKNPEAQNAHSILLENKDLYMLNPCSANIWFIVELCDHAHVTSLQLANFEMFSSTIERFQVSFSTRYPTREWSQLQSFVAKPEKSIQTFTIDSIFAKYIKVEQLSHHGTEHYCPWSLLRVYGNSMVEEYEEHESSQDDGNPRIHEDDSTSSNTTEDDHTSKGYLKSATDAVLNFVKETAKKLVNSNKQTNSTNTTNATKYHEGNSSQPLPPKTIVQLMPREEFEPDCQADDDKTACLQKNGCGTTEYTSYQAFLQIVHNVCSRSVHDAETCFSNVSEMLVSNTSSTGEALNRHTEEKENDPSPERVEEIASESAAEKVVSKDDETAKEPSKDDLEIDHSTQNSDAFSEQQSDQRLKDGASSSQVTPSSQSFSSVIPTESSQDDSFKVSSTMSPSTGASVESSVQTGSSVISSSITSSNDECDFDCAAPPLPLSQPPLAENEEPDLTTLPTQEPGPENPNTKESQSIHHTIKSKPTKDDLQSITASTDSNLNTTGKTVSQISASPTVISTHNTLSSSSTVTASEIAEEIAVQEKNDELACDQKEYKGSQKDTSVHEQDNDVRHELDMGNTVQREDIPNPHVDVLKITLTDANTNEGTAEPEQEDVQLNETNSFKKAGILFEEKNILEERKNLDEIKASDLGDAEIDIGEVERQNERNAPDIVSEENRKIQSENTNSPVQERDQNTEVDKETVLMDNDQIKLKDGSREDSTKMSEGQCEMKDRTISANTKESSSSRNTEDSAAVDPGPSIQTETIPVPTIQTEAVSNSYGKKESIFVTLSRKIKALEQNVTMTNLFLEELSQRYRKSMDEMQKKMEKKFTKMATHSKFLSNVDSSQNASILALTTRIKQLEEKLNEAISRLDAVNQEVVERHVLGMCLQFLVVFMLWFLFRGRLAGRRESDERPRDTHLGNGHLKNGSVVCSETDYRQQNETVHDVVPEKNTFEEIHSCKSLALETEAKRRRRRKNRPTSVVSDHDVLSHTSNQGQNIVSRTAGLLFHAPESNDAVRPATNALRSCSADSLNNLNKTGQNSKKSAASPVKSKKGFFQNRNTACSKRACGSQTRATKEAHRASYTRLVRSNSSGECYENKLATSDVSLSNANPLKCTDNSRCLPQSTGVPTKTKKSRWVWSLG